jgi:hypothetical protein
MTNVTSDLDNYAGQFMTGDVWQMHIRIMPHPAVPVTAAQTTRSNRDDGSIRFRNRIGNVLNAQRGLKLFKNSGLHGGDSSMQRS